MNNLEIIIDVESNGPTPGLYSMVSFGAVVYSPDNNHTDTFFGQTRPIYEKHVPDAYKAIGVSLEEHQSYPDPEVTMRELAQWLESMRTKYSRSNLRFWSDNNGFDWQWINHYFHLFLHKNPFGYSSRNLQDLYRGISFNMKTNFKKLRKTQHTHHPVDDALGNAEALQTILSKNHIKGLN